MARNSFSNSVGRGETQKFSGGSMSPQANPDVVVAESFSTAQEAVDTSASGSFGDLFAKGLNIFNTSVAAADVVYKEAARTEATEKVDELNSITGVDLAVASHSGLYDLKEGVDPATLPKEVQNVKKQLEGMTKAHEAGKLNDSHYWTQAETISRQLRQRYPGHRDAIDKIMSDLTGRVPANALRQALMSEADALERERAKGATDQNTKINKLESQLSERGLLWADYYKPETGERQYSEQQMRMRLNGFEARKAKREEYKAELEIDASQDKRTERKAAVYARETLFGDGADLIENIVTAPFMKKFEEAQKAGRVLTEPEKVEIANGMTEYRKNMAAFANSHLADYRGKADPTELKKVNDEFLASFDRMTEQFKAGDYQGLNQSKALVAGYKDRAILDVLNQYDGLGTLGAISDIAGPTATAAWFATGKNMSNFQRVMGAIQTSNHGLGKLLFKDGLQQDVNNSTKLDPTFLKEKVETLTKNITSDVIPEEVQINTLNSIFDPGNKEWWKFVKASDRVPTFERLSSPDIAKKIKELNNPEITKSYVSWTYETFQALNSNKGQSINYKFPEEAYGKIDFTWNPDTLTITPKYTNTRALPGGDRGGVAVGDLGNTVAARRNIDPIVRDINANLRALKPALDLSGQDKEEAVKNLMFTLARNVVPDSPLDKMLNKILPPKPDGSAYTAEELTPFFLTQ